MGESLENYICLLKVTIPRKYRKISCQLLIVVRLVIDRDNNMYFPYPFVEQPERWIGARFGLTRGVHGRYRGSEQEVIFDSLENLSKDNTW